MTNNELIQEIQQRRSQSISSYTPIAEDGKQIAIDTLIEEKILFEDYLFITGTYLGCNSIIETYYQHIKDLKPDISFSHLLTVGLIESWTFDNPVYEEFTGDPKIPLSEYITNNGYSYGTGNLIYQNLLDFIGEEASSIGAIFNIGYATEAEAQTAMNLADNNRNGSNLLGYRTRDSLPAVVSTYPVDLWRWDLGDNIIDNPDYWDISIFTYIDTLISNLQTVLNTLNDISSFKSSVNENDYLLKKDIFLSLDPALETYRNNIISQISKLNTYRSNFNTWDDNLPAFRSTINSSLNALKNDLSIWTTNANDRISNIINGDTIFGSPIVIDTVNNYRNLLLSSLISYPTGIIELIRLLQSSSGNIQYKISKEEKQLSSFFSTNTDIWIIKPQIKFVGYNSQIHTVKIKWIANIHCNKYKIYRRLASEIINNDEWNESYLIHTLDNINDIDLDLKWTKQNFEDTTIISGNTYVYRILAKDDWWSLHGCPCVDSASLQSDVWDSGQIIDECQIVIP